MYTREEAEGKRMKNPFDTITEGIGINRITQNFKQAKLDGAFRGSDREAVEMARLAPHLACNSMSLSQCFSSKQYIIMLLKVLVSRDGRDDLTSSSFWMQIPTGERWAICRKFICHELCRCCSCGTGAWPREHNCDNSLWWGCSSSEQIPQLVVLGCTRADTNCHWPWVYKRVSFKTCICEKLRPICMLHNWQPFGKLKIYYFNLLYALSLFSLLNKHEHKVCTKWWTWTNNELNYGIGLYLTITSVLIMVEYLYINIGVCMDGHDATIPELWGGALYFW